MGMKRSRTTTKRTRGMAMVEMVFVLPLLLLLVFAIAQFGLMFSRWLTLSNAVREGAREGVVYRGTGCSAATVETEVQNKVVTYARAGGLPLSTGAVTVTGACAASGSQLKVYADYDFDLNIPFAAIPDVKLKYESTMRNE
jgi:Flp pilus assembly protein TadG